MSKKGVTNFFLECTWV